jgi:hypothetical protein
MLMSVVNEKNRRIYDLKCPLVVSRIRLGLDDLNTHYGNVEF